MLTSCYLYRPLCLHSKQQGDFLNSNDPRVPAHDGLPPLKQRISLLYNWIEVHRWALDKTIYDSIQVQFGDLRSFNFERDWLVVELRYRPDCEGNPSIAYNVRQIQYELGSELMKLANVRETAKANETTISQTKEDLKRESSAHVGVMNVMLFTEEYCTLVTWPIIARAPSPSASYRWAYLFQMQAFLGHVVRQPNGGKLQLGRLQRRGKDWHWEGYTPEVLAQMRIPLVP